MVEVSYSFYTDTYKGSTITAADFDALQKKAILIADGIVPSDLMSLKAENMSESLLLKYNMCICNVADAVFNMQEDGIEASAIKREQVGGWTTEYAVKEGKTGYNTLNGIVYMWLSGTELMCAWV